MLEASGSTDDVVSPRDVQLGGDCGQPVADHRGAALQHLNLAASRTNGLDMTEATAVLALLVVQVRKLIPRIVESGDLGGKVLVVALKALGLEDSREVPVGDCGEVGVVDGAGLARRRSLADEQRPIPHWADVQ